MKKINILFVVLFGALVSCSKGTISVVNETSTASSEYNEQEAAMLYTNKCGTCHALQAREKYTTKQWEKIVPDMAKKAKLDASQEAQILTYVLASPKQ